MSTTKRFALSLLVTAAIAAGCNSNTDGTSAVTGALTSGRIDAASAPSSGTPVRAYGVAADGSMTAASDPATTDADGHYTLHVDLASTAPFLVVRVEDGTNRMTVLSHAAIDAAGSSNIVLPPVDAGSTFTARVDLAAQAMAAASAEEDAANSAYLTPALAARLATSSDVDAAVTAAAAAVLDARTSYETGLTAMSSGGLAAMLRADASAEATLARSLDAANDDTAVSAAETAHVDAVVRGTIDAGYDAETVVDAAVAADAALHAHLSERLSGGEAEASLLSTFATTAAVDAGAASSLGSSAIPSASATLRGTTVAAARTGTSSATDVSAAWASYEATFDGDVATHLTAPGDIVATLTGDVTTSVTTLANALTDSSASASARVAALTSFRASVDSSDHVALLTSAGLSSGAAHAVLDAMADVSATMHVDASR